MPTSTTRFEKSIQILCDAPDLGPLLKRLTGKHFQGVSCSALQLLLLLLQQQLLLMLLMLLMLLLLLLHHAAAALPCSPPSSPSELPRSGRTTPRTQRGEGSPPVIVRIHNI